MSKVKEIRKIESNIKEIKPEKKEDLEEEIKEKELENFQSFISNKKSFGSSTLEQTEISQEENIRERKVAKEDEDEINFRPSYLGGGNPYKENKYSPVGNAEYLGDSSNKRALGQRSFEQEKSSGQNQEFENQRLQSENRESNDERAYLNQQEQRDKRRKNLF